MISNKNTIEQLIREGIETGKDEARAKSSKNMLELLIPMLTATTKKTYSFASTCKHNVWVINRDDDDDEEDAD